MADVWLKLSEPVPPPNATLALLRVPGATAGLPAAAPMTLCAVPPDVVVTVAFGVVLSMVAAVAAFGMPAAQLPESNISRGGISDVQEIIDPDCLQALDKNRIPTPKIGCSRKPWLKVRNVPPEAPFPPTAQPYPRPC